MISIYNKALSALCALMWLGLPPDMCAQHTTSTQLSQTHSMDSLSYALGVLFANNLSNEGLSSVDGASLKAGWPASRVMSMGAAKLMPLCAK